MQATYQLNQEKLDYNFRVLVERDSENTHTCAEMAISAGEMAISTGRWRSRRGDGDLGRGDGDLGRADGDLGGEISRRRRTMPTAKPHSPFNLTKLTSAHLGHALAVAPGPLAVT